MIEYPGYVKSIDTQTQPGQDEFNFYLIQRQEKCNDINSSEKSAERQYNVCIYI